MIEDSTYFRSDSTSGYGAIKYPLIRKAESVGSYQAEVPKQSFSPSIKIQRVGLWQSLLLVIIFVLLGFAKAFSVNRFKQTFKAFFNFRIAQEICSEEKVFFHRVNILLIIVQLIITSLFIVELKSLFIESEDRLKLFLLILLFLIGFNLFRYIVIRLLAYVFNVSNLVASYTFNVTLFENVSALLLLPIVLILYFTPLNHHEIVLFLAIPFLSILLVLKLLRLFFLAVANGFSYVYIFLYICTLEIIPLVVMIKIFIL